MPAQEIGAFKIVSDRGLAARRLEAVTSLGAVELLGSDEETLNALSGAAQTPREKLLDRWQEREERLKNLERELASLKMKLAAGDAGATGSAVDVDGVRVVTRIAAGLSIPELRNLPIRRARSSRAASSSSGLRAKGNVRVPPDLTQRPPASRIAARIGKALGGSGGGRPISRRSAAETKASSRRP